MRKKLLSILTLLLGVCAGAWAQNTNPDFEVIFERVNNESLVEGYSRYIKTYSTEGITLKGYGDVDSDKNPQEATQLSGTGNRTVAETTTPSFYFQLGGGASALHRISFFISSTKKITKVSYLICTNQNSASTVQPVLMGWEGGVSTTVDYYSLYPSGTTIDKTPDNAQWITFDLSGSGKNLKTVELYRSISKNVFTYNSSSLAAAGGDKTLWIWGVRIWTQDASVAPTTPTIGIDEGDVSGNTDLTISSTNAENIYYYWSDNSEAPAKGNAAYTSASGSSYGTKVPNVTATKYLHAYGYNGVGTSDIATFTFNVTKVQDEAGLAYGTASVSKAKGAAAFTNTLANPNSLTVTYAITNNGSGSTINATTGEVTVGSNYGVETITATSAETTDFLAGEATYTLIVEGETSDIVAVSPGYTFIADNITSTGTVGLTAKCLYDNKRLFSPLGNSVATNKGKSTINSTQYYNSLRIKSSSQDVLVFKVDRPCLVTIYAQTTGKTGNEVRPIKVGTSANDNSYGSIPDSDPADGNHTVTVTSAGLVYLTGTGDRFIAGFEVEELTIPATINPTYGIASFSSTYPLDFTNVEGLTAWRVAAEGNTSTDKITLTQVTGKVAANTGLIVMGSTANIPVTDSGTEYTGDANKLFACDGSWSEVGVNDNGTNFVLTVQNEKVVFAPVTDANHTATLAAGQAALWLNVTMPTTARGLSLVFGEETTGVSDATRLMNNEESLKSGEVYNLNGQRVAQPSQGLYIIDGKKVIIK